MTQSIMEYVFHSQPINSAFNRFIKSHERDEFKQHIYLELLNLKEDKLTKAYSNGYIDLLVYRMMQNQYKSHTSPWAKKNKFVQEINEELTPRITSDLSEDRTCDDVCLDELKKEILRLLDLRSWENHSFLKKQYHKKLFTMYYFEKKSYTEIEKLTGVKSKSVIYSVQQTLEYIKNNISYGDFID